MGKVARAALLLAILASSTLAAAPPRVVVTIKPLHALVAEVMSGVASPEALVKVASPHGYSLKPSDIRELNRTDIFFRISGALEPFTAKIVQSLPKRVEVVDLEAAPGLTLLSRRKGSTFRSGLAGETSTDLPARDHHTHEHASDPDGVDGHIWLDPENAKVMVNRIEQVLSAKDQANASRYRSNAAALKSRLEALRVELQSALEPVAGKPYIVSHDAFQYLERRFGLNAVGAVTVSPDIPPSGKRLADLRRKIVSLGAVCIFTEPQFDSRLIGNLTENTSARTGTLDPEGFALQPGPELYFTLMRKLAHDLRTCLSSPS